MTRAPCTFRESDVKRLVRAAERAGKRVTHLKMDENGVIALTLAGSDAPNNNGRAIDTDDNANPWDEVDLKQ